MDELVIPIVNYFNQNGLKTIMSCQGHNTTTMSMFWVQFHKSVKEKDILMFMEKHLDTFGNFNCNGRFALRCVGFKNQSGNQIKSKNSWNYFAASPHAANEDLKKWISEDNAGVV